MKIWRRKPKDTSARKSAAPLRETERFVPPEGVPIKLELASLGARFGAVILDLIVTYGAILIIILFLAWLDTLPASAFWSLVIILAFFAGIPYYVTSELIWHGRTLGKRMVGIRVVSGDGRALRPYQIVARNLLKQAEFFVPLSLIFNLESSSWTVVILTLVWVVFVLGYLMRHKRKQRLGDTVAGTIVVVKPKAVLLRDLVLGNSTKEFVFDQAQLDIYGSYELQTLEAILRTDRSSPLHHDELKKVALTIAKRIGYPGKSVESEAEAFLLSFYREQRERLESRQLFGEKRVDKFHTSDPKDP